MFISMQVFTTASILFATSAACRADDEPAKRWVWLSKQSVYGFGFQIEDGPHRGLWRIDAGSKRPPEEAAPVVPAATPAAAVAPTADPYGFAAYLNTFRASAGLPPLAYDPDLSSWAARNNSAQKSRGLGHHINPNCFQNCAWNTTNAASTADQWVASAGHRDNMLTRTARTYGIAFGPGPYWTLNLR